MAAPAILKIDIIADATKAQGALGKTEKAAAGTGSKVKALGQAVATGFAVTKIAEFGKASVSAAVEAGKNTARLEQVFRSMGDATGTAAKAAEDYAGSLSKKIGVDDDAIMKGQALLATFGKVSDETARTAGIFDRATAAGADLAAAGFGTIESNAVQLGKALQDPVKGITALGRSGVTFTAAQKKQIGTLVKSNKLLDAQKIVLGAVEQQVGGTAAATATSSDKMNVAWGETQESIGNALLPVLEQLAPILQSIAEFIQKNISWIMPLAVVIGVLAVAWNIASVAATLFGTSMLAALWPVLLVIAAIAALIAIGILIVKNWDKIKAAAAAVWGFMVKAWDGIKAAVAAAFNWIKANWPLLLAILTGPIGIAVLLITRNWDRIKSAFAAAWNFIKDMAGKVLGWLTAPFEAAWRVLSGVFDKIKSGFDAVGGVFSRVIGALKGAWNAFVGVWNGIELKVPEVKIPLGPTLGGWTIGLPDLPRLEHGGLVTRTGLALVHAGETFSGVGRELGAGSTVININVTTTGLGADSPQIQRQVVAALRGFVGRNGPLDIPVRRTA